MHFSPRSGARPVTALGNSPVRALGAADAQRAARRPPGLRHSAVSARANSARVWAYVHLCAARAPHRPGAQRTRAPQRRQVWH
jgi:hypothetical protein